MPLLILSYLIQIACAVHALRRGYPVSIIFLIVAFPFLGCLIYIAAVLLPELRNSRAARQAAQNIQQSIDPGRDLRRHSQALEIADTVENKLNLADELIARGQPKDAAHLYQDCLQGAYASDPAILLRSAKAFFAADDFSNARANLDALIENNPDYRSEDGHLLFARTLEALGEIDLALGEYASLCGYYSGPEAKCRYGLLLKSLGRLSEARVLFQDVLNATRNVPPQLLKQHQDWINLARREVS